MAFLEAHGDLREPMLKSVASGSPLALRGDAVVLGNLGARKPAAAVASPRMDVAAVGGAPLEPLQKHCWRSLAELRFASCPVPAASFASPFDPLGSSALAAG